VFEIGQHLNDARLRVDDDQFLEWLGREFPQWKKSTAYNYMNVAERLTNFQALGNGTVTNEALYLLAGPSVPDAVRQDAVERAEAGDKITKQEAEKMIAEQSREVIERTIAQFRANQQHEIDNAVSTATAGLNRQLDELEREKKKPLDVEGLCKAIEKDLGVKRMSPRHYQLLAQLLGQRIAVGKAGYDPVSQETVKQNEENLRVNSRITEALEALAGAPEPETVINTAYPVQLSEHRRLCRQVIGWLEHYAEMLDEQGAQNA
jgi:hypothetical protein